MKVGLIGLPQSGKTSVFNALTRSQESTATFGAQRDEIHLGAVTVPDDRFDFAVEVCHPKKQAPATLEVTDGGARVKLEESREKFGADFFAGVRAMDALALVVRGFSSAAVAEPAGGVDAARDARKMMEELLLADLTVIETRLERLEKNRVLKRITPGEAAELQTLLRIKAHLEELKPVRTLDLNPDEQRTIRSYAFVSGKPLVMVENVGEDSANAGPSPGMTAIAAENGLELLALCAHLEMEVAQMEPDEEREFLVEMGLNEPARDRLVRACYAALGYISFFTVGEDEVRAWTLRLGENALAAAGRIHSDIARTFIRAETMAFDDFRAAGGWDEAKQAGKMRLEGKEYIVKDGDIVHIRNSKG